MLRNTGISFESDGMTGYPTLDAKAHDSYGGAVGRGVPVRSRPPDRRRSGDGPAHERQHGSGSQYAHRRPLSASVHATTWIIRFDAMKGWRQGQKDIYGARVELRRKF